MPPGSWVLRVMGTSVPSEITVPFYICVLSLKSLSKGFPARYLKNQPVSLLKLAGLQIFLLIN